MKRCTKTLRLLFLLFVCFVCSHSLIAGEGQSNADKEALFCFSSDCYACREMKAFLEDLVEKNPGLNILFCNIGEDPETWHDACFDRGIPVWGVPRIFIGEQIFVDYYPQNGKLQFIPSYHGYVGFQNQILFALESYFEVPLESIDEANSIQSNEPTKECKVGCV